MENIRKEQVVEIKPAKILLCTPAFGGLVYTDYVQSLLQTMFFSAQHGVSITPYFIGNESLITRARNTCVAQFLNNKEFTHLMFVDADITFPQDSILKLLSLEKPLTGAIYPKKAYNFAKLFQNKENFVENIVENIQKFALDYAFNIESENGKFETYRSAIKCKYLSTGFMLIERKLLQEMKEKMPELSYKSDLGLQNEKELQENDCFYTFFDCIIDKKSKRYLSEDYTFCQRATDLGHDVWMHLDIALAHTGTHKFNGDVGKLFNIDKTKDNYNRNLTDEEKNKINNLLKKKS